MQMLFLGRGIACPYKSQKAKAKSDSGVLALRMGTRIPQGKPLRHFWNRTSPEAGLLLNAFASRFSWRSKSRR
jgi:hypothetical protein